MNADLSSYNWPGVLQFLYTQYQKVSLKQNMWFLEKKQLVDQIKQLQGKLAAVQVVNVDLRNKNNILQHCIRQIKFKNNPQEKVQEKQIEIPIPQRRVKTNKNQINKILTSLGLSNLLDNVNKDLKAKTSANHNLKIQIPVVSNDHKKVQAAQKSTGKYKLLTKLQQHQDGVRDLCFLNDQQYLVSVSEDSTMKIWNLQKYRQNIDCINTIKEHSGPIFTAIQGDGYLFTGGMQGIIRCWNFPKKNINNKKCLVSQWTNSDDQKLQPIWQLLYYPQKKMIFSTSSQTAIRSFQLQLQQNSVGAKYRHSYIYQSKNNEQQDIPTAICIHQNSLYAGYVNNNILIEFNLQNQRPINTIQFVADGQISTNKIISNGSIIAGAFQDGIIRVFDHSKLNHSFRAHEESVMSITFTNNPYELFSCGQDGFVKLWDMRKYQQISSFHGHKKKYDESCHCISFGGSNLVASGGVDGIINLYGFEN